MSNLATVLKKEISRLARKEVRAAAETASKANANFRGEIAELKQRVKELETRLASYEPGGVTQLVATAEAATAARISPKAIRSHRKRLGFSAENYAKILGVSMQTVYHWEQGKSRPRQSQLMRLAAVRQMGKREARAQLAMSSSEKPKVAKKSAKKAAKKAAMKAAMKKASKKSTPSEVAKDE